MSEPLLNVMKIMLLAGLYLFFVRVLWSVFSELRDPRTVAHKRSAKAASAHQAAVPVETVRSTLPAPGHAPAPGLPTPAAVPVSMGAPAAAAHGQLMVVEPPAFAGVGYQLGSEITLGRATTNGIVLDDTYVSTVHARIFLTNGSYFIEDLSSRNGSTLNGAALVATTALIPGDRVQVGATTLEFS